MRNNYKNKKRGKKAQVTIFIIIAILLVASVIWYLLLMERINLGGMPKELLPAYEYFLSCIEDETKLASSVMGSQAGYLELPDFERGSDYMPFSSQLDFLGFSVPYWYYVSGNGIAREQIPSKEKMKVQLENHLKEKLKECDFLSFEAQGFVIEKEEPKVNAEIKERKIEVSIEMPLTISFANVTARQTIHKVSVDSRLGKFYALAKKIYEKEDESLFLENYGVDVLRLYAPVDGVELTCSPKIWYAEDIREDLIQALEANVPAIKIKGDYYHNEDKYFVQDIGEGVGKEGEQVSFVYLKDFPMKMEVWQSEDGVLIAEPVGLQEGLGVLGFCYVPYHFVYDFAYPVLIQIYDNEEMFQFPIAVVIDKNKPREALNVEGLPDVVPELCEKKLTEISVYTYNNKLESVESQVKFKCFDTSCYMGKTEITGRDAVLNAKFPQCGNGYVIVSSDGYKTKKVLASTVKESVLDIILEKKYKLGLEVQKEGESADYAIVTFTKNDETITVVYPEQKEIELTEGQYEVKAYVYTNSTINLQGSKTDKCVDVPKSGIFGIFGASEEKCFTLEIPDQIVSSAVSGGGKQRWYATESELEESSKILINAEDFGVPNKVEDLQLNYNYVEINGLEIYLE